VQHIFSPLDHLSVKIFGWNHFEKWKRFKFGKLKESWGNLGEGGNEEFNELESSSWLEDIALAFII
jgi:hypothetical protein